MSLHRKCCCDNEDPPPPEDPGQPPDRNPGDPTGGSGCACFTQYSTLIVTLSGLVNCSPIQTTYTCAHGSVQAIVRLTALPNGSWAVPITYSPANSQVGYTNNNVILTTLSNAVEVRSTDNALYSVGNIRVRLQFGKVEACNNKRLDAVLYIESTAVIVQNRNAFNNQNALFGDLCAQPNGETDNRQNGIIYEARGVGCILDCASPLTCSQVDPVNTCPEAPGFPTDIIVGGTATFTAI